MEGTTENRTAFVTGADHGLGFALTRRLLEQGWTVVAGQYAPEETDLASLEGQHGENLQIVRLDVSSIESVRRAATSARERHPRIDLLINNAGVLGLRGLDNTIVDGLDYESIVDTISINSLGPLRVVQELLPAVRESTLKRLCFVSSEAGSVSRAHRTKWYGYCMSKSALNMGVAILHQHLRPHGFSFRVYHPGWMRTFMSGSKNTNADLTPDHAADYALDYFLDDTVPEDPLVMRDYKRNEWPW